MEHHTKIKVNPLGQKGSHYLEIKLCLKENSKGIVAIQPTIFLQRHKKLRNLLPKVN